MAKRAFCVGINDYPYDGSDLNGRVNDARAWSQLLVEHYGFPPSAVTVLTDEQATKANMMDELGDLLAGAKAGDVPVFNNSSHGSYVADTDSDSPQYDETMCPYDVAEHLIVDDELRELFRAVAEDAHVVIIRDSCHSGTVMRAAINENIPGLRTPDHRRVRFLNPALCGDPVLANP